MDKKVDLKNYQCVFNEMGFFGGDQRLPEKDPLKYTDILKKYDKYNTSIADINKIISKEEFFCLKYNDISIQHLLYNQIL